MKQLFALNIAAIIIALFTSGSASAQLGLRPGQVPPNQSKEFQLAAAKKVDKLVGAEFRRKQTRPLPKSTDAEFLRRSYLTAIGRIPSYDEAIAFLDSEKSTKRVFHSRIADFGTMAWPCRLHNAGGSPPANPADRLRPVGPRQPPWLIR